MTVGFFDFHQEDRNQGKDSTGDTKKERVGARNPYRRRSAHSLREGTEQSALGALPWGVCRFHVKPMPRVCLFSSSLFQGSTVAREASDKEKVSAWRLSPWSSAWGPAPLSSVFSSSLWFLFPLSYGGKLFVDLRNTLLQFSPSG